MNRRCDSIVLAEQQVPEARTAALAEYEAARAKLRHRIGSPALLGGILLGASRWVISSLAAVNQSVSSTREARAHGRERPRQCKCYCRY